MTPEMWRAVPALIGEAAWQIGVEAKRVGLVSAVHRESELEVRV